MPNFKPKKIFIVLFAVILIFSIGIAIPKLTVYDAVPVEPRLRQCVESALAIHHDNPIERLALALGKARVISTHGPAEANFELYTIFRIPFGVLRGQPDLKFGVSCSMIDPSDWSASTLY